MNIQPVAAATPQLQSAAVPQTASPPFWNRKGSSAGLKRETYTAGNQELSRHQLGTLVRSEGDRPSGDATIDSAHDNAKVVYDFFHTVLGRDSLDDKGMTIKSRAHFGRNYNNAFWDGSKMTYGDGDGRVFTNFSKALDVVGHEMAHGVTERTADLVYKSQSGALNESWSDVFGELIEQWHENPKDFATTAGAKSADWMIGEDIFTPGKAGDALRSMKSPGTANDRDPQPAHMRDYQNVPLTKDRGGVHINSGIPNKAAYETATRIGGEKTAKIWYRALTDYLKPSSQFSDAASATVLAARDLFKDGNEANAISDAWKSVGIVVDPSARPPQPPVALTGVTTAPSERAHDGIVPPWIAT